MIFAPLANNRVGYVLPATHYPLAPVYLNKSGEDVQALAGLYASTDLRTAINGIPAEEVHKALLAGLLRGGVPRIKAINSASINSNQVTVAATTGDSNRLSAPATGASATQDLAGHGTNDLRGVSAAQDASDSDEPGIITGEDDGAPNKKRKRGNDADPISGGDGGAPDQKHKRDEPPAPRDDSDGADPGVMDP